MVRIDALMFCAHVHYDYPTIMALFTDLSRADFQLKHCAIIKCHNSVKNILLSCDIRACTYTCCYNLARMQYVCCIQQLHSYNINIFIKVLFIL